MRLPGDTIRVDGTKLGSFRAGKSPNDDVVLRPQIRACTGNVPSRAIPLALLPPSF
jgi:hypothetical protein